MYLFFLYDEHVTTVTAAAVCALVETYTTNANWDWMVNVMNAVGVDLLSVQEIATDWCILNTEKHLYM